jgi:hypothetical protein
MRAGGSSVNRLLLRPVPLASPDRLLASLFTVVSGIALGLAGARALARLIRGRL